MSDVVRCPKCERELGGLATYCHFCREYTADLLAALASGSSPSSASAPVDDRLEDAIQEAGRKVLELAQFDVYNLSQARASRQTAGIGDTFVVGWGRTMWIEWKRPGGKQTAAQEVFEERVLANGGEYHVWTHEDEAAAWAVDVVNG